MVECWQEAWRGFIRCVGEVVARAWRWVVSEVVGRVVAGGVEMDGVRGCG